MEPVKMPSTVKPYEERKVLVNRVYLGILLRYVMRAHLHPEDYAKVNKAIDNLAKHMGKTQ